MAAAVVSVVAIAGLTACRPDSGNAGQPSRLQGAADRSPTNAGQLDDIAAIKRLRERDAAASLRGDYGTLRTIMSDDAVVLPPGSRLQVGRAAIDSSLEQAASAPKTEEVLEYRFDLSEPEIVGNLAVEYGLIHGRSRNLQTGEVTVARFNVMRVLRKESDGEWRVYRTMWAPGG